MKAIILFLFAILISALLPGCAGHHTEAWEKLDSAEALLESDPDSARSIISSIQVSSRSGREERARYALINTAAIDRCGIDTTDLKILQPAIDYYPDHGTPDQRLRTLYYQGRIFQNRIDDEAAMKSFIEAREIPHITDSLTFARLLVAQGALYFKQYKGEHFADNNIKAAPFFIKAAKYQDAANCYARVLNIATILEDTALCDSMSRICRNFIQQHPETANIMMASILTNEIKNGDNNSLQAFISTIKNFDSIDNDSKLALADAFLSLDECDKALGLLSSIENNLTSNDSLKYYILKSDIHAHSGNYTDAYESLKNYVYLESISESELIEGRLLFAEERYLLEKEKLESIQKRNSIIIIIISISFIVTLIALILYYKKRSVEAECDRHILAAKNLEFEKNQLEAEHDNLKSILENKNSLGNPIQEIIRQRIDFINDLLVKKITEKESTIKGYKKWIDNMYEDKNLFKRSTHLAMKASHPEFMSKLEKFDLTEDEIEYACLYAIGLNGKEIGNFLGTKGHYNISSTIRKKIGLTESDTNLGIFIKKLMAESDN